MVKFCEIVRRKGGTTECSEFFVWHDWGGQVWSEDAPGGAVLASSEVTNSLK